MGTVSVCWAQVPVRIAIEQPKVDQIQNFIPCPISHGYADHQNTFKRKKKKMGYSVPVYIGRAFPNRIARK